MTGICGLAQSGAGVEGIAAVHGIMNVPAVFILFALTMLLIRGTQESAVVNSVIVVVKVTIVLMVIAIGWGFINPANHTPFIPEATTYVAPSGIVHNYGIAIILLTVITKAGGENQIDTQEGRERLKRAK